MSIVSHAFALGALSDSRAGRSRGFTLRCELHKGGGACCTCSNGPEHQDTAPYVAQCAKCIMLASRIRGTRVEPVQYVPVKSECAQFVIGAHSFSVVPTTKYTLLRRQAHAMDLCVSGIWARRKLEHAT